MSEAHPPHPLVLQLNVGVLSSVEGCALHSNRNSSKIHWE